MYKNNLSISIKKGDNKSISVALASIFAKVKRDEFMINLHKKINFYNWHKNKGYGTKEHFSLIQKFGISKYHRKTFLKKYFKIEQNSFEKKVVDC